MEIHYEIVTAENLPVNGLDAFVRTQPVRRVWRRMDGHYQITEHPFTDDWPPERKRKKAAELRSDALTVFGAFDGETLIGFAGIRNQPVGNRLILDTMHVSQPYRRSGIGRALFRQTEAEAIRRKAGELYISAESAVETVAFYQAMGAEFTDAAIPEMVEAEPLDVQMVKKLSGKNQKIL